jgi:hypothetical protein
MTHSAIILSARGLRVGDLPTLTVVALALRLADHLKKQLAG